MRIQLNNVGCLSATEIDVNGITVISGLNSTGKSTVLKALYCAMGPAADFDRIKSLDISYTLEMLASRHMDRAEYRNMYEQEEYDPRAIVERLGDLDLTDESMETLAYVKGLLSDELDADFYDRVVRERIGLEFDGTGQFSNMDSEGPSGLKVSGGPELDLQVSEQGDVHCDCEIRKIPRVVYLDSPFNMDAARTYMYYRRLRWNHRDDAASLLSSKGAAGIIMGTAAESNIRRFDAAVGRAVSGTFFDVPEGIKYRTERGHELSVCNVAAGIKMFGMIRILVDKGHLREGSVLMLDEPEVHLHPQWINLLADVLVILARDLGVKVIMTTHNPQMLMAVEAKSGTGGLASYYHLTRDENGNTACSDVTGSLEIAYGEMARPVQDIASHFWK